MEFLYYSVFTVISDVLHPISIPFSEQSLWNPLPELIENNPWQESKDILITLHNLIVTICLVATYT